MNTEEELNDASSLQDMTTDNSSLFHFNKKHIDYSAIFAAFSSLSDRSRKGERESCRSLAKQFNISKTYISKLKYIFENGDEEIINLICSNKLSIHTAFKNLTSQKKKAS